MGGDDPVTDFRDLLRVAYGADPLHADHFAAVAVAAAGAAVPDYQLASWLTAVYLRGLSPEETYWLTMAMARSGGKLAPSPGRVDKHSTGGVGDKTTLVVAPLVASLGIPVAKMSGRGLGHTGGTLDKLESIPGFRVGWSRAEWEHLVRRVGVAVAAQTDELAPADGRLYALRDATATVDSPALIAASIMSKKIAGGAPALVLDVKVGRGSFNPGLREAHHLARLMLSLAERAGLAARALVTEMDQPLGHAVGNALEVNEAWRTLLGGGPADFRTVALAVAGAMVDLADPGPGDGRARAEQALASGRAAEKFLQWVAAQQGDAGAVERGLPVAPSTQVASPRGGTVASVDPLAVGRAAMDLGAGRRVVGGTVNPRVGVEILVKVGDVVRAGEPVAVVYGESEEDRAQASVAVAGALRVTDTPLVPRPPVLAELDTAD
jgi:pyrimidine-nucleoside phosphorylase